MAVHKVDTDAVSRMLIFSLSSTSGPTASRIVDEYVAANSDELQNRDERRIAISRELFSVYTALLCYVVEKLYVKRASRVLEKQFLSDARKLFMKKFQAENDSAFANYKRRTAEYAEILCSGDEGSGLSSAFLRNTELESIADSNAQEKIANRFRVSLNKALDLHGRRARVIK